MKIFNIKAALLMIAVMLLGACQPIEDRDELSNSFNPDDIELTVVQATEGGNKLSIQMNTPGVTGFWDYILDKKYSDRVEVVFPFTGTHQFTYHVTTPYIIDGNITETEFIEKSVEVTVNQLDEPLPPTYYLLVGDDLGGKSWAFDGTGSDGGLWWFMSDPNNPWGVWWNAGGDCCPPSDVAGKMRFDLNGGQNFTYWSDAAGTPLEGSSFIFNSDYSKLTIIGDANILGSEEGGGNNKEFDIVELTADKMVLHVPNAAWATGWTWVFKVVE